jgi:hypothetical protein
VSVSAENIRRRRNLSLQISREEKKMWITSERKSPASPTSAAIKLSSTADLVEQFRARGGTIEKLGTRKKSS